MPLSRLFLYLGLAAAMAASLRAVETERNYWPACVTQLDSAGEGRSWESLGPLLFRKPAANGGVSTGFRPVYVQTANAQGTLTQALFLYPLFSYAADDETFRWSIFELVRQSGRKAGAPAPQLTSPEPDIFEVWPFWFSRQDKKFPENSYRAFFPIHGTMKNRFGYQELSWTLFPFYARSEKRGAVNTMTPWPFIRTVSGTARGFSLWPIFGWQDGPAGAKQRFYLWPFGYNNTNPPAFDAPAGSPPTQQLGVLPFYTRETSAGFINENYGWPFFGYTDRTQPYRYHETRYFWPFFVQARGDERLRNRWAPFYTHSVVKGYDKTWVLWPLYRQAEWSDDDKVIQNKKQVLFFLYYNVDQRSATNPSLPHAHKTHIWPLLSSWDNGAGKKQLQVFSPFEVFFPNNDKWRQVWTPLLAVYRYDQTAPGFTRQSFLWSAVTLQRQPDRSEFHLGPLFSIERSTERNRVAFINGLLSLRRGADGRGWRMSWLDFPSKQDNASPASR